MNDEYLIYEDNPEQIVEFEEDDIYKGYGESEYQEEEDKEVENDDFYERDIITGQKGRVNPLNATKMTKNDLDEIFL
jgi:hypothetical protein